MHLQPFKAQVIVLESTHPAFPEKNAYSKKEALGVDRFMALVGAPEAANKNAMILQTGTAWTLDLVNNVGAHLGGYINPSPLLSIKTLLNTTQFPFQTPSSFKSDPGLDSDHCVFHALVAMWQGLIQKALSYLDPSWQEECKQ